MTVANMACRNATYGNRHYGKRKEARIVRASFLCKRRIVQKA